MDKKESSHNNLTNKKNFKKSECIDSLSDFDLTYIENSDIKERFHYALTKEEFLNDDNTDFQWFFELDDGVYTLYCCNGKFVLHEYFPPCDVIYESEDFNDVAEYIYGKGTPSFFGS